MSKVKYDVKTNWSEIPNNQKTMLLSKLGTFLYLLNLTQQYDVKSNNKSKRHPISTDKT